VVAHATDARPEECCGLLIGRGAEVLEAIPVPNIAETKTTRFELDPAEYIRARREARARGRDVIGFYHSHPHTRAEPSATDLAEALYPEHVYLIVGWRDGMSVETRAFLISGGRHEELTIVDD
jgi:proteasome lid subunit RPN8/RPN11